MKVVKVWVLITLSGLSTLNISCAAKQEAKSIPRSGCMQTYLDAEGKALRIRCVFQDGTVADFQRERVVE